METHVTTYMHFRIICKYNKNISDYLNPKESQNKRGWKIEIHVTKYMHFRMICQSNKISLIIWIQKNLKISNAERWKHM